MAKGVELRGLTRVFPGGVRALDGIDLAVLPGEFFTLLGPSGCGKTTLLRTIAGFERPDAGEVLIGGASVAGVPAQRRSLGVVFQSYAVFPHLTVLENVAFGLRMRGIADADLRRRALAALERVRLADLAERTPDTLSGGQQQRVGLARALVIEPDALLMDEPLSNLDARLRIDMRDEVRALQRALGITTIYVTHDQEEALAVSDRIAVMKDGRVEQTGTPLEVYADPATASVAGFVGRVAWLDRPEALGLVAGGRVALRPEHVTLGPPGGGAREGYITHAAFTGPVVTYRVTVGDVSLLAEERAAEVRPLGARVAVRFDPLRALRFDAQGRRVRG